MTILKQLLYFLIKWSGNAEYYYKNKRKNTKMANCAVLVGGFVCRIVLRTEHEYVRKGTTHA